MYECVGHPDLDHDQDSLESDPDVPKEVKKRPSAMDLTSTSNGRRSMWSELPEVLDSGILDNITCEAKKLHEAMFEVITSEASYLKSLNILMKHFAQSPKLSGIGNDQFLFPMKKFVKFWRNFISFLKFQFCKHKSAKNRKKIETENWNLFFLFRIRICD